MKRNLFLSLISLFLGTTAMAQQLVITGEAKEKKSGNPVEFASVALLRSDSTAVLASTTDENGHFAVQAKESGKYIVRLSFIGYTPIAKNVELTAQTDTLNLGTLFMQSSDNVLSSATVSVTASRVEQKGDTTMFNAAAYRVPTGSTLESLVKQLPGVEVDDNGGIKWNGKTVSEFLINGKDFFKGDTETAMKNLPSELVNKIKAYDKKSDYAEQTGIDDGEETTVLDITTKRALNESWITNLDVAYGSHDRFAGRLFASRFTERSRISAFGNVNNTNNKGFGSPHGFGGGSSGNTTTYAGGLDFTWQNDKEKGERNQLELGGNVRYRQSKRDALSISNSETFLTAGSNSSFSNAWNKQISKNKGVNTSFRLQWKPDTLTTINFRPSYAYSESHNNGSSRTATFNDDPYGIEGMNNPLDSIMAENAMINNPELYAMMVNTNNRLSLGDSKSHQVDGTLNIIRRLNANGRNISLRASAGYSKSESNNFSISNIKYNENNGRQGNFLNQYSTMPSTSYNYSVRLGYVEPIAKNWFAEARYQFAYKYNDGDRSRFNLDSLGNAHFSTLYPEYASYGDAENYPAIGSLPTRDDVLNAVRDTYNSQYATYKYYNHTATLGIRYNSESIRFNAGVDFNPERTRLDYTRAGLSIDTVRNVFTVSPQVRFRYKFSRTNQLEVFYRGRSSQPSMTDLLSVVDDSNPLNISMGNPGLKPSWSNSLRINYNGYNPDRQQGIMVGVDATQTRNSISNRMVYDATHGVRYTRPENINGNWNSRGMFMFNSAIGADKLFNISTFTALNYRNDVGYVSKLNSTQPAPSLDYNLFARPLNDDAVTDRSYAFYNSIFNSADSQKNTTRTLGIDENLNLSYRGSWFDVGALGRINYQHSRASIQENNNMDTWNFAYGANANFNFNFGMSISTDIRMSSRRGYTDASMNTNELLWNAQVSQSFLKNRAATISIQFYDILQQQSNVSRTLTATQRTDAWTNEINSYFLVHFIYKFNSFTGKSQRGGDDKGERMGPPDMRGPGAMPMMPMGGGNRGGGGHF